MQSVLDIKKNKPFKTWSLITIICIIFSTIYEYFSFGVISLNMVLTFIYPLLLGVIPSLFIKINSRLYNDGILCLIFGSILKGIFDIYGTSSIYPNYLMLIGIGLILIGIMNQIIKIFELQIN